MADIVAIGEPLFEFNQVQGTTRYQQGFGGDSSNFVCAAARVGASCAYLSRVGDEEFGRQLLALWRREGVDCSAVELDAVAPTGIYFVSHTERGHEFSYRRAGSAACAMRFGAAFEAQVRGAKFLHLSGISQAISPQACDCVFDAIRCAREHGVRISYDLNYRPKLWPPARARAIAEATLRDCDLFLPSVDEAGVLFGVNEAHELIDWAHRLGARNVAVKLGGKGALVSDGGRTEAIAGFPVDAIDATGAGDCFGGVLVARLVAGDSLVDAARAACAAAALSTTGFGAVDPLPGWERVHSLLKIGG